MGSTIKAQPRVGSARSASFYYFDRYADGDPYEEPGYRENFQIILRAMRERKPLFAAYAGGKGRHMTPEVLPCRLQYSPKDDKFRLLFMVAAAYHQHAYYLQTLSFFSSRLKNQDLREGLIHAASAQEAYQLLMDCG